MFAISHCIWSHPGSRLESGDLPLRSSSPLTCCVPLGKSLALSGPLFSCRTMTIDGTVCSLRSFLASLFCDSDNHGREKSEFVRGLYQVLQGHGTNRYLCIKSFVSRYWLMQLWGLTNLKHVGPQEFYVVVLRQKSFSEKTSAFFA